VLGDQTALVNGHQKIVVVEKRSMHVGHCLLESCVYQLVARMVQESVCVQGGVPERYLMRVGGPLLRALLLVLFCLNP
jgi:hypothetical protein